MEMKQLYKYYLTKINITDFKFQYCLNIKMCAIYGLP